MVRKMFPTIKCARNTWFNMSNAGEIHVHVNVYLSTAATTGGGIDTRMADVCWAMT